MRIHIMVSIMTFFLMLLSCRPETVHEEVKETFVMSDKMLSNTETAVAEIKNVTNRLNFYGKIVVDNNKMVEIFPVVGGNVTKVHVELGDYVKKGQLLAVIQSTEVAGYEKELDDARNDLLVASNRLKVINELLDSKLATENDVMEAQNEFDKAKSQLSRIQETYKIYNIKPGALYEVRSPLSGFIIEKSINEGMLLRSDKSDNIFDVAQIDDVIAMANINESDIGMVKMGIDAEITTLSYPDRKFYGTVDKIYNIIDPETKAMQAGVKLKNNDFLLKPDMRVTINLSYTEDQKMIAIPSTAIIFDKSKYYVMIFKDRNNLETRQVEVFRQLRDVTYISAGLYEGENVMTTNQLLIYDAMND